MMIRNFIFFLVFSVSSVLAGGTLSGTVYSKLDGSDVKNAQIKLAKSAYQAVTDEKGYFEISDIRPGTYTLIVTHIDFIQFIKKNVEIQDGARVELRIGLDTPPGDVDRFMSGHMRKHSAKHAPLKTAPKEKMPVPPPIKSHTPEGAVSHEKPRPEPPRASVCAPDTRMTTSNSTIF